MLTKPEIWVAFLAGWLVADQWADFKRARAIDSGLNRLGVSENARRNILDLF